MNNPLDIGDEHIWSLDFPQWHEVTGRQSIADLYKPGERCGIYVLGFANGERYVGQAVDVVRRFTQHCKTRGDITHMTFRKVKKADLNAVEKDVIHTLDGRGLQLRNISLMSVVTGERDLDLVVSPEEQEQWLTGEREELQDAPERVQDQALQARYVRRFEKFMEQPHAADALFILGLYLQMAVPFPRRTELSFWAVSCLPDTSSPSGGTVLFRVNLNMQEVFTLVDTPHGLEGSFHLARSPYEQHLGENWADQLMGTGWGVDGHAYEPGGQDQFNLWTIGITNIMDLLMDWGHAQAMCLLNLRLMRKGATYYGRSHCLALVEAALSTFDSRQHELVDWFQKREESLMNMQPISGLFHFASQAYPANFNPQTWLVEASIAFDELQRSLDLAQERPATFESAAGGHIVGYARYVDQRGGGHQFQLRLKSLLDD